MSMVLNEGAQGDPRNALFLAQACALAYLDEPAAQPRFADQLGLEAKLISVENIQAYVAENDGAVVVAFRGSQAPTTLDGLKDWLLTNADNYLVIPEGRIGTDFAAAGVGARFHRGFMEALHEIWEPLLAAITEAVEASDRPLWITGHSMGGSLALLAAWRLQRNFITVHEVVTFGAPMTGNLAAAEAFEQEFAGKIPFRSCLRWLPIRTLIVRARSRWLRPMRLPQRSTQCTMQPPRSWTGSSKPRISIASGTLS